MGSHVVIEERDRFLAFLAGQPLCLWCAAKERDIATGRIKTHSRSSIHESKPAADNSDLAAALASMA